MTKTAIFFYQGQFLKNNTVCVFVCFLRLFGYLVLFVARQCFCTIACPGRLDHVFNLQQVLIQKQYIDASVGNRQPATTSQPASHLPLEKIH